MFLDQGDMLLDFLVCLFIKIYSFFKIAYLKSRKFCQPLKRAVQAPTAVKPGSKHFTKIAKKNLLSVLRIL